MTQLDLLEYDGVPAQRNRQSIEAAKKAVILHKGLQTWILRSLKRWRVGSDRDLYIWFKNFYPPVQMSSVVSARNSLVRKGLVYNTGEKRKYNGRNITLWGLK